MQCQNVQPQLILINDPNATLQRSRYFLHFQRLLLLHRLYIRDSLNIRFEAPLEFRLDLLFLVTLQSSFRFFLYMFR